MDRDLWLVIEAAVLLGKGLPPVFGGLLDQSGWFIAAAGQINAERNYWKSKSFDLE